MRFHEVIWVERFVEKIESKHGVWTNEVEEVLFGQPLIRRAEKGHVKGEDVFAAYGQTTFGRYLIVFFIRKRSRVAMPISTRDMTSAERRYYEQRK